MWHPWPSFAHAVEQSKCLPVSSTHLHALRNQRQVERLQHVDLLHFPFNFFYAGTSCKHYIFRVTSALMSSLPKSTIGRHWNALLFFAPRHNIAQCTSIVCVKRTQGRRCFSSSTVLGGCLSQSWRSLPLTSEGVNNVALSRRCCIALRWQADTTKVFDCRTQNDLLECTEIPVGRRIQVSHETLLGDCNISHGSHSTKVPDHEPFTVYLTSCRCFPFLPFSISY